MIFHILNFVIAPVSIGSFQHLFPILIGIGIAITLIRYARNKLNENSRRRMIHVFAWIVSLTVISFHLYRIYFDNYNFKTDLPLYLCSFLAILIPIFTYFRKYWMFEILLFWIIGGTIQGVITPDIPIGFPSFDYFRYWIVHLGLLSIIFYFIFVFDFRPKLESVVISFLALQVYVMLMMILNYFLDSNYFYLNEKPKSASLLDYFGEWPNYIWLGELIILPLFLLIYLPFYIEKRRKKLFSK